MSYVIVGSGPTGLSLAYNLALNNKKIILIEQNKQLGGSYNSQWINNKYWSENSPRVMLNSRYTDKLMKHIGMKKTDFKYTHGNAVNTTYKISKFIFNYFNIIDYIIFLFARIQYELFDYNITMSTWMKNSCLSLTAIKAITMLCIVSCDIPEKTNIRDFFSTLVLLSPKQMTDSNKWHKLIENYLNTKKNIIILKNTKVIKLESTNNKHINNVNILNLKTNKYSKIKCFKVFLCTQSNGIYPILSQSSQYIRNNWMNESQMKLWSANTYYIGFGFQLHFTSKVLSKDDWCWSCLNDWTIIILKVSNWLKKFSKDPKVKTVWSCCIVDMTTKSKNINKTPNECNLKELIDECMFQINSVVNIPKPYKITISNGIKRINNKWISENTGYTKSTYNDLPIKGKINNLYALGCFTKSNSHSVAHMGSAIEATSNYLKKYENNLKINIFK
jgi:hypothetical protein